MKNYIVSTVVFLFLTLHYFKVGAFVYAKPDSCSCDDPKICYSDGCTRKTLQNNGTIDTGICKSTSYFFNTDDPTVWQSLCVAPAPCCLDMVKKNDAFACCWPERGACHPYYCNQLTGSKERCGWYWQYHAGMSERPGGYACTKGTSATDLYSMWGLPPGVPGEQPTTPPTQPPQPTNIPPTAIPTPTKVIIPTYSPVRPTSYPTRPPLINPTQTPQRSTNYPTAAPLLRPTNAELPISIGIGIFQASIKDVIANVKISVVKTAVASKKILDLPNYAGGKILDFDHQLEMFMNGLIEQVKTSIFSRETRSV